MRRYYSLTRVTSALAIGLLLSSSVMAKSALERQVDEVIAPMMHEQNIPGLAVGIFDGQQTHFFNYGLADKTQARQVDSRTLFEIGSISKVFTGLLGAKAIADKQLNLNDRAVKYAPWLKDSALANISVAHLGTYRASGLPLQFPDTVLSEKTMQQFYRSWHISSEANGQRQYSNPSIGLFGYVTARALKQPFAKALEEQVFGRMQLQNTYLTVPKAVEAHYAYGYDKNDVAVRVNPGVFDQQAYGIKTTVADLLSYVRAHIEADATHPMIKPMVLAQYGFYEVGKMTQGLGWESYAYPVTLATLVQGNSSAMALNSQKIKPYLLPQPIGKKRWYNKTGSTNGFGAYAAFIPQKKLAIVLLANKNYPNAERVKVAHAILSQLDK
ncbi:MAG: class C beta-lactamase [Aeromonas sp.]